MKKSLAGRFGHTLHDSGAKCWKTRPAAPPAGLAPRFPKGCFSGAVEKSVRQKSPSKGSQLPKRGEQLTSWSTRGSRADTVRRLMARVHRKRVPGQPVRAGFASFQIPGAAVRRIHLVEVTLARSRWREREWMEWAIFRLWADALVRTEGTSAQ
jgi:hypothetical protein